MWKVPSQGKSLSYSVNPYNKTVEFENSPQRKMVFPVKNTYVPHFTVSITCTSVTSKYMFFKNILWHQFPMNPTDLKMLSRILKKAIGIRKALITVNKLSKLFSFRHCIPFWGQKVYNMIPHSVLSAVDIDKKHKKIQVLILLLGSWIS